MGREGCEARSVFAAPSGRRISPLPHNFRSIPAFSPAAVSTKNPAARPLIISTFTKHAVLRTAQFRPPRMMRRCRSHAQLAISNDCSDPIGSHHHNSSPPLPGKTTPGTLRDRPSAYCVYVPCLLSVWESAAVWTLSGCRLYKSGKQKFKASQLQNRDPCNSQIMAYIRRL